MFLTAGLEYSQCVLKMRLLTIASLTVEASEVSFSDLMTELDLTQEEVELLVIEGEGQWNMVLFSILYPIQTSSLLTL